MAQGILVGTGSGGGGGDGQTIQVSTLPAASADEFGNVYQYIGADTANYTHGYFYECVSGETAGTYIWKQTDVQSGGDDLTPSDVEDIKRNFTVIPYVEQPIPMTETDVQAVKNAFVIH